MRQYSLLEKIQRISQNLDENVNPSVKDVLNTFNSSLNVSKIDKDFDQVYKSLQKWAGNYTTFKKPLHNLYKAMLKELDNDPKNKWLKELIDTIEELREALDGTQIYNEANKIAMLIRDLENKVERLKKS